MKQKKPPSPAMRHLTQMMSRPAVQEVLSRMACSEITSDMLRAKSPVLYWCILVIALPVMMLPMVLFIALCPEDIPGLLGLLAIPGVTASILAGLGTFNLYMLPVQKLCAWQLRHELPLGLEKPLYLGHGFTCLFLFGFEGLALLFALFFNLVL